MAKKMSAGTSSTSRSMYENYRAWRNLATGRGTIGDAAYLVHEIAEVKEFQRFKEENRFDFMKTTFKPARKLRQWRFDFQLYYLQAHSKALEAEYQFITEQILKLTNGHVKISRLQAAAIDPTRPIGDTTGEMEAWRYMLVDGIAMKRHVHFATWRRKANQVVSLRKKARSQLGYHRKRITLENLIRYPPRGREAQPQTDANLMKGRT